MNHTFQSLFYFPPFAKPRNPHETTISSLQFLWGLVDTKQPDWIHSQIYASGCQFLKLTNSLQSHRGILKGRCLLTPRNLRFQAVQQTRQFRTNTSFDPGVQLRKVPKCKLHAPQWPHLIHKILKLLPEVLFSFLTIMPTVATAMVVTGKPENILNTLSLASCRTQNRNIQLHVTKSKKNIQLYLKHLN